MKKLLSFLTLLISNLSAQTKSSPSIIGEWSSCGTWDFNKAMTFKKDPMDKTLSTCPQRPCHAISLDFKDSGVKLKSRTGCPGELSVGSRDDTMTWTLSSDKKTLTLIKSDKR